MYDVGGQEGLENPFPAPPCTTDTTCDNKAHLHVTLIGGVGEGASGTGGEGFGRWGKPQLPLGRLRRPPSRSDHSVDGIAILSRDAIHHRIINASMS